MRKIFLLFFFAFCTASLASGGTNQISVIPCPSKVEAREGTFDLGRREIKYITDSTLPEEGYCIDISKRRAEVSASGRTGFLLAAQTLRQLEVNGGRELLCCRIEDAPRFKYRGVLIDCARHFYPKEEIFKILDILAFYKLNRMHWHLTDDHGWRIEIKQYPRLVEVGAFGDIGSKPDWDKDDNLVGEIRYEGYYTQDDIREVVAYADSLGIVIVPEIDMPGHMTSALAAYSWLGCTGGPYKVINFMGPRGKGFGKENLCIGKEETFTFVENVLKEVVELFPSEYIHIGGDECITERWDNCPLCQKRQEEEGMKLQNYFTKRVQKILEGYGRKIIGWDEILEGELDVDAVIMSWRGTRGGINAAKKGMDAIMSPSAWCYFDKPQSKDSSEPKAFGRRLLPVDSVYAYNPVAGLDSDQARHIIGVQGNLWCDVVCTDEYLEYMLLPRVAALSEVQWCDEGNRDWKRFVRSMDTHRAFYEANGYVYAKHLWGVAGLPGHEHRMDEPAGTGYPDSLRVQGGINHVQGIAYDSTEECFYCSFTTAFYKVSADGRVLSGIEDIHGHLGALTFDEASRKVYASLECKDDEIGRNISKGMGKEGYARDESRFYIAEIDVDRMTMETFELPEVRKDYLAGRFACSGIDGVSIAPRFGRKNGKPEYLYVAYGIYGDTERTDNDYNIILCYRPGKYNKPVHKYFVHTGNTTYGVQNLCYDSYSGRLYMAVYRGKKESYPNYALFALDIGQKPVKGRLEGVPYETGRVLMLNSFTGWHQNLGSTGICSMGDGFFYIGANGKDSGRQVCDFTLYRYSGSPEGPLERVRR